MNKEYYIITGANGSIGQALTEAIAAQGHAVIMACRNLTKAQPVQQRIIEKTGNPDITLLPLDLASFASIIRFSEHLSQKSVTIQALLNNAGVMNQHFSQTTDGFESTIGVNYIGTVLLTRLLLPLMHPGSRIVTTTSLTRFIGKIDWVDPLANRFFRPFISSPQEGAAGALFAATKPEAYGITGEIFKKQRHTPISPRLIHEPRSLWLYNETGKRITEILAKQSSHAPKT